MSESENDGIQPNRQPVPDGDDLDLDTVRLLIDRAKEGDSDAHSQLVQQVQSYLNVMVEKKMPNVIRGHQNVSDIVQQTMIQMVQGIEEFRGESTREFYGWLNRIMQNESSKAARDLTRQKRDVRRRESLEGNDVEFRNQGAVDQQPSPRTEMIAQERIALFYKALKALSEQDAKVIQLRNLDELSFSEIAKQMDATVEAVSKRWCRAIVKFQAELERISDDTQLG